MKAEFISQAIRLLYLREHVLDLYLLKHPLATESAESGDPRLLHLPVGAQHNEPSERRGFIAGRFDHLLHNVRIGFHNGLKAGVVLAPKSFKQWLKTTASQIPLEYPEGKPVPIKIPGYRPKVLGGRDSTLFECDSETHNPPGKFVSAVPE